jgi:lipopolysaccharide transport system ATP-binding protein
MRRKEIQARYDEIVEFSGIEKFMETPVKRYSSGMFVRLAFSVAAHFEPEILLIDEVLSVGDAEFQRKCLNKMEAIAHSDGHTVVYVSHSLQSVRRLCDRVALIEGGRLVADGTGDSIVANYMNRVEPVQHGGISTIPPGAEREGTGEALVSKVSLQNRDGELIEQVHFGEPFAVSLEIDARQQVTGASFMVQIASSEDQPILTASNLDRGGSDHTIRAGEPLEVRAEMDTTMLPGEYVVNVAIVDPSGTTVDHIERVLSFTALNVAADGSGDHYPWDTVQGYVRPDTTWSVGEPDSKPAAIPLEVPARAPDPSA